VTFFQPPKTSRKKPQLHHKNTINIHSLFPKPPKKTPQKGPKSTPDCPPKNTAKGRKMLHLRDDHAGPARILFARSARRILNFK
jgi:hypothetical protein